MKYAILIIIVLSQYGCVSRMLSIGHEEFVCSGDTAGGKCMSTTDVYSQKSEILNSLKRTDVEGETSKAVISGELQTEKLNGGKYVYEPPKVLKVKVFKYRNQNGDLVDDTYMYILANDGRWLSEVGNTVQ